MVEAYQRRSALAHFGLTAPRQPEGGWPASGITLGESAHRAIINIRGDAGDGAFIAAVKNATGVDLPVAANTVAQRRRCPRPVARPHRMVGGRHRRPPRRELVAGLRQAFTGQHTAVIDVSESRTVITIIGPGRARRAGARFQPRSPPARLRPRPMRADRPHQPTCCLHQTDNAPAYEIYVLKSFSDYLGAGSG